ncbi:MAG: hypothetical protein ABII23_00130, partial [bacterium]
MKYIISLIWVFLLPARKRVYITLHSSIFITAIVMVILSSAPVFSAGTTRYWKPSKAGAWSTASNWDPAGVPDDGDTAIFNSGGNFGCTIDQTDTVTTFTIQSGYTATIDVTHLRSLTVSGTFSQADGVFTNNGSHSHSFGNFTLTAGEFQAGSAGITVTGSWSASAGIFNDGNSIVNLTGTGNVANTTTNRFYNVKMGYNTKTTTLTSDVHVQNNVTFYQGIVTGGSYDIKIYNTGTTPLSIDASSTMSFANLELYPTATTVNIPAFTGYPNLYLRSNTASDTTFNVQGVIEANLINIYGNASGRVSTLDLNGFSTTCTSLYIGNASASLVGSLTTDDAAIDCNGNFYIYGNGTLNAGDSDISVSGIFEAFSGCVFNCGSSEVTLDGGSSDLIMSEYDPFYDLNINTSGTIELEDKLFVDNDLTIAGGTLDTKSGVSYSIDVGGSWLHNAGTFEPREGTVTLSDSSGTSDIVTAGSGSFYSLVIDASGATLEIEDSLDIDYDLTITAGTLTTKSDENNSISIGRNLSYDGGIFNLNESTVTFDGSEEQVITGSIDFYGLKALTPGATLWFEAGTTFSAASTVDFKNVYLRSSTPGSTWYFNLYSASQTVKNVDVKDSNASGGAEIMAVDGCTNSGNNTNWFFGGGFTTLTWDGSESTDWNTVGNWNHNAVPLSTQSVIIPNSPNVPQLNAEVAVATMTILPGGELNLNNFNITISSAVELYGSLTCTNTEHITISGDWSAYSGSSFTHADSTVTFNGSGTFNILSNSIPFNDVEFNQSGSVWTLSDDFNADNNLTFNNGELDTGSSSSYAVNIGSSMYLNSGTFDAHGSTITVGANWSVAPSGTFTIGTSSVSLQGTGNLAYDNVAPGALSFYNFSCAYAGEQTLCSLFVGEIYISNKLSLNGGTIDKIYGLGFDIDIAGSSPDPLAIETSTSMNSAINMNFHLSATTVNIPAYSGYPKMKLESYTTADTTYYLQGEITANLITVYYSVENYTTLNLNGNTLNCNSLMVGFPSGDGWPGSIITSNGDINCSGDFGIRYQGTLHAGSSQINVGGDWLTEPSSEFYADTSTVTFTGSGEYTIESNGDPFNTIEFDQAGSTWTLVDALSVSNILTIQNGELDTDSSGSYAIDISSSLYINGGSFEANGSTITVGANWDSADGNFVCGTSTVTLTGTGNLAMEGSDPFEKLSIAASGNTTTITCNIYANGEISFNGGTVNQSGSQIVNINAYKQDVLTIDPGTTMNIYGISFIAFTDSVNLPAYTGYPNMSIYGSVTNETTFYVQAGGVTTGDFIIWGQGSKVQTLNLNGETFTCSKFDIGFSVDTMYGNLVGAGGILNCTGDFKIDQYGRASLGASTQINVGGDFWTVSGSNFDFGTSTITMNPAGGTANVITLGSDNPYNFEINATGGAIVELEDSLIVDKNLTITAGTFDTHSTENNQLDVSSSVYINGGTFNANDSVISFAANWDAAGGGTFNCDTSEVNHKGSGYVQNTSANRFYDVSFGFLNSTTTLDASITYVDHILEFDSGMVTDGDNSYSINVYPDHADPLDIDPLQDMDFNVIRLYPTAASVNIPSYNDYPNLQLLSNTLSDTTFYIQAGGITAGNIVVDSNGSFGNDMKSYLVIDGEDVICGDVSIGSMDFGKFGEVSIGTGSISCTSLLLQTSGILNGGSSAISVSGTWGGDGIGTGTFNAGTSTVTITASGIIGNPNNFYQLEIDASGTITLEKSITVANDLNIISGTLDTKSSEDNSITIGGDWTISGGAFNVNQSTVTFNKNGLQVLTGDTPFYNLLALTSGATLQFNAGDTFSVTNKLDLENIYLRSSSDDSDWYFNYSGSSMTVKSVDVRDSNANGGESIYATDGSTNTANNANWYFDGTGLTLTWTGNTDSTFETASNWSPVLAPAETSDIIIPDTTNKPELGGHTTIKSLNISEADAELILNDYDLTVSSDVTLSGTLTVTPGGPGETIVVGGDWDSSGGFFDAQVSTVKFDGTGEYTILSDGNTFYDANFMQAGSTWTLSDQFYTTNNLTITSGELDTNNSNSYAMSIGSSVVMTGGSFEARGSTITVGASWDASAGAFNMGTSSVSLTGSGNVKNTTNNRFYNLSCAYSGSTTILTAQLFVQKKLSLNGGRIEAPGLLRVEIFPDHADPLYIDPDTTALLLEIWFWSTAESVNLPSWDEYGELQILLNGSNDTTYTLEAGGIGAGWVHVDGGGGYNTILDLAGETLNCTQLYILSDGVVTTNNGAVNSTGDLEIYADGTLNAGSSQITVGNDWYTHAGSTFDAGTSTVTMNDAGGTSDIQTEGTDAFKNLVINAGATIEIEDDLNIDGSLTITAGTLTTKTENNPINLAGNLNYDGGTFNLNESTVTFNGTDQIINGAVSFYGIEALTQGSTLYFEAGETFTVSNMIDFQDIFLRSSSQGSDWYFEYTGSSMTVENVTVEDSNASGGDPIYAINSTNVNNNDNWYFDGTGLTLTWTGNTDSVFDTASNWNPQYIPTPTSDIIIPDTPNKPEISKTTAINSLTIQSGGELKTSGYDLDVSTYVILAGTITCTNKESITVGGDWNAAGGYFDAQQSSVTFDTSGTYDILSDGNTFYDIYFHGGSRNLLDNLYAGNNLTLDNSSIFYTNDYKVNVASSLYNNMGVFYAGASTITVKVSWIADSFFVPGKSWVRLTGTGNLSAGYDFYNLSIGETGKVTTLISDINVTNSVSFGKGEVTGSYSINLNSADSDPINSVSIGSTLMNFNSLQLYPTVTSVNIPSYAGYPDLYLLSNTTSDTTFTLSGAITAEDMYVYGNGAGKVSTLDMDGKNITCNGDFNIGSADDTGIVTTDDAAIDCSSNLYIQANGTLNAGASQIDVGGTFRTYAGSSFDAGSSTVTMNDAGGTSDIVTEGTDAFKNLIINAGATIEIEDDLNIDGNLTITAGTLTTKTENNPINLAGNLNYDGGTFTLNESTVTFDGTDQTINGAVSFYGIKALTPGSTLKFEAGETFTASNMIDFEDVYLRSTSDGTTWYFNYSGSSTTVKNVDVMDSNASGGDEIDATDNCTNSDNNTHWKFRATPTAPTFTQVNITSFTVSNYANGNPGGTYYSIRVTSPSYTGYADSGGNLVGTEQWVVRTSEDVIGLLVNNEYTVSIAACDNGSGDDATPYGSTNSTFTLANLPGIAAFTNVAENGIQANWTDSNPNEPDFNVECHDNGTYT